MVKFFHCGRAMDMEHAGIVCFECGFEIEAADVQRAELRAVTNRPLRKALKLS